jgi:hypothetical protein
MAKLLLLRGAEVVGVVSASMGIRYLRNLSLLILL